METIYKFIHSCIEHGILTQLLGSTFAVIGKVIMDIREDGWPIDNQYLFLIILFAANWFIIIPGIEWFVWDVVDFSSWGGRFYGFRHQGAPNNIFAAFFLYLVSNLTLYILHKS